MPFFINFIVYYFHCPPNIGVIIVLYKASACVKKQMPSNLSNPKIAVEEETATAVFSQ